MTVFDLFSICNTERPEIIIYNDKIRQIYRKRKKYPLGNFDAFLGNRTLAYIYKLDADEILLRIE